MESDQCLEDIPRAKINKDICLPSMEVVKQQVLALLRKTGIKSLFVASDVEAEKYNIQTYIGRKVRNILIAIFCVYTVKSLSKNTLNRGHSVYNGLYCQSQILSLQYTFYIKETP